LSFAIVVLSKATRIGLENNQVVQGNVWQTVDIIAYGAGGIGQVWT
jgi:hypothetical protein